MNFERIRDLRENAGFTLKGLAKILNLSKSTCSRWEHGEAFIPMEHLIEICNLYQVTLDYALAITNTRKKILEPRVLDKKELGKNLKTIRKKHHLTQAQLAKLWQTSQSTISSYEKGNTGSRISGGK